MGSEDEFKIQDDVSKLSKEKSMRSQSIDESMQFNLLFFTYQVIRITDQIIEANLKDENTVCENQG